MTPIRIFKWTLEPERRQLLMVPEGTRWLSVANQLRQLVIWGEVPQPVTSHEPRILIVTTTGDEFKSQGKDYIGTVILDEWYVAHVYEQHQGHKDPIDHRNAEDRQQILDFGRTI